MTILDVKGDTKYIKLFEIYNYSPYWNFWWIDLICIHFVKWNLWINKWINSLSNQNFDAEYFILLEKIQETCPAFFLHHAEK